MTTDEKYMMRCLQLAQIAEGMTSPNPMVGAVIVHSGKIIGEGYHHGAGLPHAEPNAINSVKDKSLLANATMYVSLEPCSHWGKTPPCADLIVKHHLRRVVVAILDPNPKVSGRGVEIMQNAGIEVTVGVLEQEAREINRRFLTVQEQHRPYVILKWAQTADHYIDICRTSPLSGPIKISNTLTKTLNHQIRSTEDAIMVATDTVCLDNPHLTINKWSGKNPIRVILDRTCRIPVGSKIFDTAAPTIVFTACSDATKYQSENDNVTFKTIDFSEDIVRQILTYLATQHINSIIIEGGAHWLQTVIDSHLWDEARIETSPLMLKSGVKTPKIDGITANIEHFGQNIITTLRPIKI